MRKVPLLPSLITTGNFFCGMLGMTFVIQNQYLYAAESCLVAMLFDFVDGQVARHHGGSTRFGVEFDSLADMLSFGIVPTFMAYSMILAGMGRFGMAIAFLYAVCCALRLARYNIQLNKEERRSFTGLPTPAAGGLICSVIVLVGRYDLNVMIKTLPFLMLGLSYLMVCTLRYPAFNGGGARKRKPFLNLVGIVISAVIVVIYPEISFFILFAAYAAYGVLAHFRFQTLTSWIRSILLTEPLPEDSENS
ncbi:MAG: CDP-diacylglycerol--serine O-phosphatidyltransferase [Candidatus Aureabacteria bacterium]|nr:CDP-diacylglycerol--serine O-phosphatidyltransferase [Candidatus Auribacterota bacterium]